MLTPYDWVYGIAVLTAVALSIIAGFIALSLFDSAKKTHLNAWKPLIVALILFALEEILGALKVFGVWKTLWLTHVIPSFILLFLIIALIKQINIAKGWHE